MSDNKKSVHRSPFTVHEPIPYGRQHITDEDIDAVIEVLKSDYLTQGPKILEFEQAFAEYIGSKYAVAVANGTAALHLCALALGVKPGDKVITTPITFAASANCVRYCGGEVVFADIDPQTYLLDINKVRNLLKASPKGTYQGIIPVDFAGRPVNLEEFRILADEYDLWIIEDACHAPGGSFIDSTGKEQKCGNGVYADLAIFSFHPVKHIAAGEGGMITTNNEELFEQLLMLRTHGITKDSSQFTNSIDLAVGATNSEQLIHESGQTFHLSPFTVYPSWYMEMQTLGYNYRLTDFQAALGLSQLQRAEDGLARRREIALRYKQAFKDISQITDRNFEGEQETGNREQTTIKSEPLTVDRSPFTSQDRSPFTAHAFHLYVIEVEDRLGLYNYLREDKIYAQIHYIPCHLMPYYQVQGWQEGDLPEAETYYSGCISLPMYPMLGNEEQRFVVEKIKRFHSHD